MKWRIAIVVLGAAILVAFAWTQSVHDIVHRLPFDVEALKLRLAVWQWLAMAGLAVAGAIVGFAAAVVCGWTMKVRERAAPALSSPAARRGVRRSIGLLSCAGFWWSAIPGLELPANRLSGVMFAIQVLTVVAGAWLLYSLWDGLCDALIEKAAATDRRAERLLVPVTRKLVRFLIVLGGSLIGLAWIGANVAGVLAGLGIGGLAVALAAKDSVENVFGSLTILFDMPFAIGDWVKIGPVDGVVEEINLRSTRIRTFQDSMITLPNSNLIKASVENFGARRFRQLEVKMAVPFDTAEDSVDAFCSELKAAIAERPTTRREPIYVVRHDFADAGLVVMIQCFIECDTFAQELEERQAILRQATVLARAHHVRMAGSPRAEAG